MDNTNPQGDQITTNIGGNAHNVAIGKEITQTSTTVTSSGDHSVAIGGSVSDSVIVTGANNQVYVNGRKTGPPLHYPPRAEHFVDRQDALKELLADLHPGRVVTLCGPGGIGKSALAAEVLAQLASDPTQPPARFPDGVFFHSFYNQKEVALALEQIARSFGEEPRPTPALAAQRALAGKRSLLILDGAEDADDLPAVLAVRGQCGVLVTSRKRSDAVAERQDVKPLPTDEAVHLLQQLAGARALGDQATAARSICTLVGDLPLAVRLVGRYLAETALTATEYLAWLQQTPLQALDQGSRRDQSVNVLLERSVKRLSPLAQQALGVVGALALAGFPADWVALALAQATGPAPSRPLGELVNYGLLLRQDDGQYTVSHALIHAYAAQLAPPAAVERLATHFDQLARQQTKLGPPGFAVLDVVLPHLLRVLDDCVQCSLWAPANQLVWAVQDYLDVHGRWLERVQVAQVGVQAARHLGKRYDEGAHFSHLGLTYSALGQMDKAIEHYQQSIVIYREIDNRRGEGADLGNLGNAYRDLGQVTEAIDYYQQALAINRQIGDRRGEGSWLGSLGNAYRDLGQVTEAIDYYQQALAISRQIGDRRGEGSHLGNLGIAYRDLGQVTEAIDYYQQALAINRQIGDRRGEGSWLGSLGNAYRDLGQVTEAIDYYQQAIAISRQIGDRRGEGSHLGNLGIAYRALGQVTEAIDYYQQALAICRQIGDRRGEGSHLGNLGIAYRALGQVTEAIDYYQQALAICRQIGDRRGEGSHLGNLGIAYRALGQVTEAIDYYQQALAICRQIGDRRGEGIHLGNLAGAYRQLGQLDAALTHAEQGLQIAREIHAPSSEAYRLWELGFIYRDQGGGPQAHTSLQQALELFEQVKSPEAAEVRSQLAEWEKAG